MTELSLEEMAQRLEASGRYQILRKLETVFSPLSRSTPETRLGLYVDVETTGLDPSKDEVIEVAMVPFTYRLDGEILAIGAPYHRLRQPNQSIDPEITALTGLDDAKVAGHHLDLDELAAFVAPATLIVAHNAGFDRRFMERLSPVFTTKAWGCSMSQVDWASEGFQSQKLVYLAAGVGVFYDQHRAVDDCLAALKVLSHRLPKSGVTGFHHLLNTARQPTWRIWAENSPFDLKDVLKARGYRWNGELAAGPRCWFVDVVEGAQEAEIAFLQADIYQREIDLVVRRIDAYDRFSDRI